MNLSDFSLKDLGKNLRESKVVSNFVNEFMDELKDYLEKGNNKNIMNVGNQNKYSNY